MWAELSVAAFVLLTSFFFRALGMQIQALKRARWGADHDISGYSGGESIFTRLLFGPLDDPQKSIDRERSTRMFLEPLICLIAALFLWPDAEGVFLFFAAPAMLFKQLREFHYMRRKQQSMHTRQEKVEWVAGSYSRQIWPCQYDRQRLSPHSHGQQPSSGGCECYENADAA